ncbi:hypothetical protein [Neosynechococcus sphagnicola]|uniref:hypothetical protein n=1 Tax=Neosynechococcus sphagnicola TaxID=1501145 RepID=UPI000B1DA567|nr:hypothetical protein [Neosynechococcus sphagnicola]
MTLVDTYRSQIQHLQESPKYRQSIPGKLEALPFPGYTVITPPWSEDPENDLIYQSLQVCQQQLLQQLMPGFMAAVTPRELPSHLGRSDLGQCLFACHHREPRV